jgi:DivIVA domain-containing protein
MDQLLLPLLGVLVVGAVGFGVALLISGRDPGLQRAEPDGRAVPLPGNRPLGEVDIDEVRFDTVLRGYRMNQVDAALRRVGYDIGYKEELIRVLQAEVDALRDGRVDDADALRRARDTANRAIGPGWSAPTPSLTPDVDSPVEADPAPSAAPADDPAALSVEPAEDPQDPQDPQGAWRRQETKLG